MANSADPDQLASSEVYPGSAGQGLMLWVNTYHLCSKNKLNISRVERKSKNETNMFNTKCIADWIPSVSLSTLQTELDTIPKSVDLIWAQLFET